eukprot:8875707-Prorocentrum_lima.AAC.1
MTGRAAVAEGRGGRVVRHRRRRRRRRGPPGVAMDRCRRNVLERHVAGRVEVARGRPRRIWS